jgi:adenylate cyclase
VKSKQSALGISGDEAKSREAAFFEKAAKHPSATYYQLLSDNLLYQQKSDEAVAAAERAIALDPSDPWSHEQMAYALLFNGRSEDARIYLDASIRLDPATLSKLQFYIAGLADFSMGRFEAATVPLEKINASADIGSYWDSWPTYVGLRLLIATYGHLGRDATSVKERLKPFIADWDDKEFTVAIAMSEFPFKRNDAERLVNGLRKAGVSDLGERAKLGSSKRLHGPEIRALIFGHTAEGREIDSGDAYHRETAEDGAAKVTVGSREYTPTLTTVEDNFLCSAAPTSYRECGGIFRNPEGTPEKRNEYRYIRPYNGFEFSVTK